jgi:hypothetical protein
MHCILNLKFIKIIFKSSVPASQKTQRVFCSETNWLILLREIMAVDCDNRTKQHRNSVEVDTEGL